MLELKIHPCEDHFEDGGFPLPVPAGDRQSLTHIYRNAPKSTTTATPTATDLIVTALQNLNCRTGRTTQFDILHILNTPFERCWQPCWIEGRTRCAFPSNIL
jgi:hypothetical protein